MAGYRREKQEGAVGARSAGLRRRLETLCHTGRRHLLWASGKYRFAGAHEVGEQLPCVHARHRTLPLRCSGQELQLLGAAVQKLDGLLLQPGETMSLLRLVGRPGDLGVHGEEMEEGLCRLGGMILWMTLHTPLTVEEHHPWDRDTTPEERRPRGSGAACRYPRKDLMITNDTAHVFQLRLAAQGGRLEGQWRCDWDPYIRYRVVERESEPRAGAMGGCCRRRGLYRQGVNPDGEVLFEELVAECRVSADLGPAPEVEPA